MNVKVELSDMDLYLELFIYGKKTRMGKALNLLFWHFSEHYEEWQDYEKEHDFNEITKQISEDLLKSEYCELYGRFLRNLWGDYVLHNLGEAVSKL